MNLGRIVRRILLASVCGALAWTFAAPAFHAQESRSAHAALPSSAQPNPQGAGDVLLQAMRDEMARSMKELRLAELERPYFIAYHADDTRVLHVSASRSSLLSGEESHDRSLSVEVRVGDYAFDNTNFIGGGGFMGGFSRGMFGMSQLPLDDDYRQIRRQFWLATDEAYKHALESIAGKRAALQNHNRTDDLPDFTKEEPTETHEAGSPVTPDRAGAEKLTRELSSVLAEMPDLYTSSVRFVVSNQRNLYLNSEGTFYEKSEPLLTLTANASTQALDGMPLSDSVSFYARSLAALGAPQQLAARIREMGARLESLRKAPLLERYNGPVLFEARAAAEIISMEFAPALLAQRKPISGQPGFAEMFERMSGRQGGSLASKLGARVLPDFLSVADNPTAAESAGKPLFGGYTVDDQGVRAHATQLIEKGILKTLLSTRTPVEGVPQSTGNRRGSGPAPSNLIVSSDRAASEADLKKQLLELVKKRGLEYGVIVREVAAPGGGGPEQAMEMFLSMTGQGDKGRAILCAYRLYPDGREELVRGVHISGMGPDSFKDILAASDLPAVYTSVRALSFDFASILALGGGDRSMPISSYSVPALLFEDLTLVKPSGETPKPPLSDPPATAR
jgi:TldD protein